MATHTEEIISYQGTEYLKLCCNDTDFLTHIGLREQGIKVTIDVVTNFP